MSVKCERNVAIVFAADLQSGQPQLRERKIACPTEADAQQVAKQLDPLIAAARSSFAIVAGRSRSTSSGASSSSSSSNQPRIITVKVRSGAFVDNITLVYSNKTTKSVGADGGKTEQAFSLAAGEHIVKIVTRVEKSLVDVVMKQVEFHTSAGRQHGPYGQPAPSATEKVYEPASDQMNAGLVDMQCNLAVWMPLFGNKCLGPNLQPVWKPNL
jgi:hypothetical protein